MGPYFNITLPDGSTRQRFNASRDLTHAIVGQVCEAQARAQADAAEWRDDLARFAFLIARSFGGLLQPGEDAAEAKRAALAEIDGAETDEAFLEGARRRRHIAIDARKAAGEFEPWHVLTWVTRQELAQRQLNARKWASFANRQIVEVTP